MKRTIEGTIKRVGRARAFASTTSSTTARVDQVERALAHSKTQIRVTRSQIDAALALLLDEQCTLPFVARYRKERTNGLDEHELREIERAAKVCEALEAKRASALDALQRADPPPTREDFERVSKKLREATTVEAIEDLIGPYRTKTSSRADKARALGCDGLAREILTDGPGGVEALARKYVSAKQGEEVKSVDEALSYARDVLADQAANEPTAREAARRTMWTSGRLSCALTANGKAAAEGKSDDKRTKKIADAVRDYYDFNAPLRRVKPHQTLAIFRAESAKVLRVKIDFDSKWAASAAMKAMVGSRRLGGGRYNVISEAVEDGMKRLLSPSIEREAKSKLKVEAMERAIADFGANLRALLLQPPLTPAAVVLGVDPAYRTGCKLAVVDPTGALLETGVVYLPQLESKSSTKASARGDAADSLRQLVKKWGVSAIAIGDGTASRETEAFVASSMSGLSGVGWRVVSEAGASVYSASELAAKELPNIDVSLRGAVSIARRLQDPMAELVKISPENIGIGLYQHDVKEKELADELTKTVESAVAVVGANLNTSSQSLLSRIPGLGPALAAKIVRHRDERGQFSDRAALKTVSGVGSKTYEQIIGFLRVPNAADALEHTSVHPESYAIARRLLSLLSADTAEVINLADDESSPVASSSPTSIQALKKLKPKLRELATDDSALASSSKRLGCHALTLKHIADELAAPGDDARARRSDAHRDNVLRTQALTIQALKPGDTIPSAVVRNVVPFGVFLDIGVGRDALLHVTHMKKKAAASDAKSSNASRIVDPHDAYSVGQSVDVEVLSVDIDRQRISVVPAHR